MIGRGPFRGNGPFGFHTARGRPDGSMHAHQDTLNELNKNLTLTEKLRSIHSIIRKEFDFIERIAVALYDSKTDLLKTFSHSSGGGDPLIRYQAPLGQSRSLTEILKTGHPRVINDLTLLPAGGREHSRRIAEQGYRSSYTMPMYMNGLFFGFIFFDSPKKYSFVPDVLHRLDLYGHLISLTFINELMTIRTMLATVKAARDITAHRDLETGEHLDRMSYYSRLIARQLAGKFGLDDEFVERVFLYSPLHDIGKIGVPDAILRKRGRLSPEEFEEMKAHTLKGREIIDEMLEDFGLESLPHIDTMRNIAEYHHESVDGKGYPEGLKGTQIPLEARIIAVADIFDALTSRRPYKSAWSNEQAFLMLRELSGHQLDKDCVEALIRNREEVEKIQAQFRGKERE
jgi:HD-GYP domain-containing protein (c-di-GMP phosphodiesterase class II)